MIFKIAVLFILVGVIIFLSKHITKYFNNNYPTKINKKNPNYAILIPARNESNVIEKLLLSIEKQTVKIDPKNVYIIVESITDETVDIAKKHNMNIFIRQLLNLKRKGYALMEVIEEITKTKKYDAYFIFDADNVLDENYFKEMTKTYLEGYDIGIGYRNILNKDNSIATSSSLIFTIINVLSNNHKSKYHLNCNASGTGFYISGKVINELKTYPFHTLTEDYELSLYACVNNLTCFYNKDAVFYDEQPTTYKQYVTQRTRWIKGYLQARNLYRNKLISKLIKLDNNFASTYEALIGVYDILLVIIGLFLMVISFIFTNNLLNLINILAIFLAVYIILAIFTIYLLSKESRYNLSKNLKIKTILINPFMLFTYIPCFIKALFIKDLEWDKINHGITPKNNK